MSESIVTISEEVAPFTGAWIEIYNINFRLSCTVFVAPFTGAWIEIPL